MTLERSSHLPGGFQVRHHTLGIYQGSAIDLAFWHPSSNMPEYGLCRFSTEDQAHALIDSLCSAMCTEPLDRNDLTVEPYDLTKHDQLVTDYPLPSVWETPLQRLLVMGIALTLNERTGNRRGHRLRQDRGRDT